MIRPGELLGFALGVVLSETTPSEAALRRALSGAYYGLFHSLTSEGAQRVAVGDADLAAQIARAYSHSNMRRVCEAYARSRGKSLPQPIANFSSTPVSDRLIQIAEAFVECHDARVAADYDLRSSISRDEALAVVLAAYDVPYLIGELRSDPDFNVFLTALLLADRWTRRG